jgi:hypothetical protein
MSTSTVRTVCGSSARTDLCGGRSAMTVPTAIPLLALNVGWVAGSGMNTLQTGTLMERVLLLPKARSAFFNPVPLKSEPPLWEALFC